ncbi:hypothetical protein JJC03_04280 [Flavobacterium oreochromis]|uniref:hypothetical protein n=1 Tax=Flavobacterium oreochromis TaxID=2906078 RepID=UPI001CE5CE82|nr:hypothetical protein [Flavobacterium oreochromis]QYS87171.1 hypothetical protein JJC03_04280 [Flavobacterium oreochromis]
MKNYNILKPKNLNLENLTNRFKPDFKFNFEKAYLIIHIVLLLSNKKSNNKKVELHSKMLENLFGKEYHKYFKYFTENFGGAGNVLNRFPYSENHCFSYILREYFYRDGFEIYTIKDYRLINKFKSQFLKLSTNENIRLEYHFLLKHFKRNKLTVKNPQCAIEEKPIKEREKYLKNAFEILKIMNQEYTVKLKTQTDGRVHSNITRLSKISRKYLIHENENLVEIDVKSAVPFILYLALQMYLNQHLSYLKNFQYKDSSIVYIFDEITGDIDKTELNKFGVDVISGQLYQNFMNLIFEPSVYENEGCNFDKVMHYYQKQFHKKNNHYFDGDLVELKDFVKRRMLSMFFAPSHKYKFEQIAFKNLYPTILKFINEFKAITQHSKLDDLKWEKRDAHKKLSHFCFQFEAKVMIDNIAREFDLKHKGKVPIYTLHDCLITTQSNAEELLSFMKNKFNQLFGVAPALSYEVLTTGNTLGKAC